MKIEGSKLKLVEQALQYGIVGSRNEAETAEFAMLAMEVVGELERERVRTEYMTKHAKQGCIFLYCSQNPKCKEGERCKGSTGAKQ